MAKDTKKPEGSDDSADSSAKQPAKSTDPSPQVGQPAASPPPAVGSTPKKKKFLVTCAGRPKKSVEVKPQTVEGYSTSGAISQIITDLGIEQTAHAYTFIVEEK